jgi:hypothetical protein
MHYSLILFSFFLSCSTEVWTQGLSLLGTEPLYQPYSYD